MVLQPKDAALLAVIALSGPVKADQLGAMLWPSASTRQADTNLRQRLFRLRRRTAAQLVETGTLLRLADDLRADLAAVLESLQSDERLATPELLGEHEFDDLPELAEWVRAERRR